MQIQVFAQLNLARHCEAEGRGNPGRFIKDLEKTMTAIELQKSSSLGHAHASVVATLAYRHDRAAATDTVGVK